MANDLDTPSAGAVSVEIWRNRVYSRRGVGAVLDAISHLVGGPPYHLLLVVRYDGPEGEVGRYEIYEPEAHPPRPRGGWHLPANLGGFLQRRASARGAPRREDVDPAWDLHLVWAQTHDDPRWREFLDERALGRYRWRDHYPRWIGNVRGRYVNSNAFVEKVALELGLRNRDGSPIDFTGGGRFHHPGLGLAEGWEFAFDGDTRSLHAEWNRLHGDPPPESRRWWGPKVGVTARHVRAAPLSRSGGTRPTR
jgi:hypothetical protein